MPVTVSVIVRVVGSFGRSKPLPVVVSVLPVRLKFAVVTRPAESTTDVSDGDRISAGITSRSVTPKASVSLLDDCLTTIVYVTGSPAVPPKPPTSADFVVCSFGSITVTGSASTIGENEAKFQPA